MAARGARFRNLRRELLLNYRIRESGQAMSTHPDRSSWAEQSLIIQRRHAALLSDNARALSRRQAARALRPAHDGVAMRLAMRRNADAQRRSTLLLASPFFAVVAPSGCSPLWSAASPRRAGA